VADGPELRSERLLLRRWRAGDLDPFAQMNADRQVMEFYPARIAAAQSAAHVERIEAGFVDRGFGLWAAELPGEAGFNVRSRRVMERLHMRHEAAEDFAHPSIAAGDRLSEHVVYRADAARWLISSRHVRPLHQHDGT
jgi:RimJ/RimL family protein N-acetyltransferase